MRIPNVVVVDDEGGVVYVSDSHGEGPGPGIWRYDIEGGEGGLWYSGSLDWANGMVLTPDRSAILVAESWGRCVTRIPIASDGSAGAAETEVTVSDDVVIDGLTLDADGNLILMCYAPSRVYRRHATGALELLIDDPDHSVLCHPTNGVLRDGVLYLPISGGGTSPRSRGRSRAAVERAPEQPTRERCFRPDRLVQQRTAIAARERTPACGSRAGRRTAGVCRARRPSAPATTGMPSSDVTSSSNPVASRSSSNVVHGKTSARRNRPPCVVEPEDGKVRHEHDDAGSVAGGLAVGSRQQTPCRSREARPARAC